MPPADLPPGDHFVEDLAGRRVGYREYGAAHGFPVIALHGTPGSRFKFEPMHEAACARGLRLVSLDRWGYGLTGKPHRWPISAYAGDVEAVANVLELERFAVMGLSGGGPYAVSAAHGLGARVVALALISPVGDPAALPIAELDPVHGMCFRVLPRIPGFIALAFRLFRWLSLNRPDTAIAIAGIRSVPADAALFTDLHMRASLVRAFRAGLEAGVSGAVIDMDVFSKRWDFDRRAIDVPARLWIGTMDGSVPVAAALKLANELGHCELSKLEGQGHFWILQHANDVLDWIAEKVQASTKMSEPAAEQPHPAR